MNCVDFKDLNRQVVQANTATIAIPKLEFENPPNKGGMYRNRNMLYECQ